MHPVFKPTLLPRCPPSTNTWRGLSPAMTKSTAVQAVHPLVEEVLLSVEQINTRVDEVGR